MPSRKKPTFKSQMSAHALLIASLRELDFKWGTIAQMFAYDPVFGNDGHPKSDILFKDTWMRLKKEGLSLDQSLVKKYTDDCRKSISLGDVQSFVSSMIGTLPMPKTDESKKTTTANNFAAAPSLSGSAGRVETTPSASHRAVAVAPAAPALIEAKGNTAQTPMEKIGKGSLMTRTDIDNLSIPGEIIKVMKKHHLDLLDPISVADAWEIALFYDDREVRTFAERTAAKTNRSHRLAQIYLAKMDGAGTLAEARARVGEGNTGPNTHN
jgi:hypothetical protein